MKKNIKGLALTGLVSSLALVLSLIEIIIPPLPLIPPNSKLGLSNVAVMFSAGCLGLPSTIFVASVKGVFAFFTRGIISGAMSFSAGLASGTVMYLLFKRSRLSLCAISIFSSLIHNAVQLVLAYFLTGLGALYFLPSLLIFGTVTGILSGLILKLIIPMLDKLSKHFLDNPLYNPHS